MNDLNTKKNNKLNMTDYTQSVIYMIVCNDESIQEGYIGSTSNFKKRQLTHKTSCKNKNSIEYNILKYQFIRANGGWENWRFEIIERYPCKTKKELQLREDYWYLQFDNLLNDRRPFRTKKQHYIDNKYALRQKANTKYDCECGGKYTHKHKARHFKTKIHLMYLEKHK